MREKIYHITTKTAWDEAKSIGFYRDNSLVKDGFIHCSYPEQIVRVANHRFKQQTNLLILAINRSWTNCSVVDEDLYNLDEQFPHIYGPLPISAVFDVIPFPSNEDGGFSLPDQIIST